MTITLTREEAQQILDVLWNAFDLQQEEINQHIIKYGEFYRPQRVEFMKKELGSIEQMKETINNKIAQPEKTDMQIGLTYEEANPPTSRKFTPEDIKKIERKWHEPVAWVDALDKARPDCVTDFKYLSVAQIERKEHLQYIALYPAMTRREWVGLTDEEANPPEELARLEQAMIEAWKPIPKKEWVGLTAEEIDAAALANGFRKGSIRLTQIINAIEAKLKEKNI
jgi:DNA-directed RNA polymerase subunit F